MLIPIRLTIDTYYELPDDFPKEDIQLYLETTNCIDNVIAQIYARLDQAPSGTCSSCHCAAVKVLDTRS